MRDGAARQITADHAGLTPSSITRFLGDPRGIAPDVFVEVLRRRDRLVLCSDGLTRHVSAEEIAAATARVRPDRAARALVDLANERGGEDNVTVAVYAPTWRMLAPRLGVVLLLALVLALVIMAAAAVLFAGIAKRTAIAASAMRATDAPRASSRMADNGVIFQ